MNPLDKPQPLPAPPWTLQIKEGETIIPPPRTFPYGPGVTFNQLLIALQAGHGIARGPLVQDHEPEHIHPSGGPWAKGLTADGKTCWV